MVELIVALAILGVLTAVVGLSLHAALDELPVQEWQYQVAVARDSALRLGRSVTIVVRRDGETYAVTLLPDGRVIGPSFPANWPAILANWPVVLANRPVIPANYTRHSREEARHSREYPVIPAKAGIQ